jgi:hypothetical protein
MPLQDVICTQQLGNGNTPTGCSPTDVSLMKQNIVLNRLTLTESLGGCFIILSTPEHVAKTTRKDENCIVTRPTCVVREGNRALSETRLTQHGDMIHVGSGIVLVD